MWSNQIRPHFCTPPEWWDIHPRRTSRLQEWAKTRKTENTEMPKADMKVKTGWGLGQKKLDLKGDSLRQKQSQRMCKIWQQQPDFTLLAWDRKSESAISSSTRVKKSGWWGHLKPAEETSTGKLNWMNIAVFLAPEWFMGIFVTNSLITVYRKTQLDLKQTKYDHFYPFYYCWALLE